MSRDMTSRGRMTARERILVVLWLLCSALGLNESIVPPTFGAYVKCCKQDSDCRVGYYCDFRTLKCVSNK